jgi:hypothetical protein
MIRRILLISIDDLRFDALSCESDTRFLVRHGLEAMRDTPNLDRLAEAGTRFPVTITTAPYTPSSHASMLTGLYPPAHGVRAFMTNPMATHVTRLPEMLREAGFRTIASLDVAPMFQLLGLTQGFEDVIYLDDAEVGRRCADAASDPLFLFCHLEDVHPPVRESLQPPSEDYNQDVVEEMRQITMNLGLPWDLGNRPERQQLVTASNRLRRFLERRGMVTAVELPRYLAGVNKFDAGRFSHLWSIIGPHFDNDDSLVIITADHGQGTIAASRMADRTIPQKFDHGEALLEELLRVPLLAICPGLGAAGNVVSETVSLVDIAPTILDAAGLRPPSMQGRSLVPALSGDRIEPSVAYAEVWYHDRPTLSRYLKGCLSEGRLLAGGYHTFLHERSVREGDMKLVVRGAGPEVADLETTPEASIEQMFERCLGRLATPPEIEVLSRELSEGVRTRLDLVDAISKLEPRTMLFDMSRDPFEEIDLLSQTAALRAQGMTDRVGAVVDRLMARLDALDGSPDEERMGDAGLTQEEMAEVEDHLRALGYVE